MKIRYGFVSNSSSSSFIIIFDKKPTGSNDILNQIFSGKKTTQYKGYDGNFTISSEELSKIIYNEIVLHKSKKGIRKEIFEILQCRYGNISAYLEPTKCGKSVKLPSEKKLGSNYLFMTASKSDLKELYDLIKKHQKGFGNYLNLKPLIDERLKLRGIKIVTDPMDVTSNIYYGEYENEYESIISKDDPKTNNIKKLISKIDKQQQQLSNKINKKINHLAKQDLDFIEKTYSNNFIFCFSFGDSHGSITGNIGYVLETGSFWKKIKYIRVSD
jgi:hypothetical protein